jgi:5-oxoprolinase (ATP-hydrolysing) subunit A
MSGHSPTASEPREGATRPAALDINVDMGESFGRWKLGDDEALMAHVTSASIACGFHAGDPATMRATVHAALAHSVQIGAHVGLPDLLGFGRRRMAVAAADVRDYATYQIGALKAFVDAEGGRLEHVKPHGALYAMCSADPELASAVAEATAEVDRDLLLLLLSDEVADAVEAHGVRLVTEAFPDLEYRSDGTLVIEPVKRAWDPERVASRAVRLVREHVIDTQGGGQLEVHTPTVCLHGDAPNATDVARIVRRRLEEDGVEVAPLRQVLEHTVSTEAAQR